MLVPSNGSGSDYCVRIIYYSESLSKVPTVQYELEISRNLKENNSENKMLKRAWLWPRESHVK